MILWAYLDTGSGRNFISQDATAKLKLSPLCHETPHIVTVSGSKKQSMPVFQVEIGSLDGVTKEQIEVTGTKMPNFTIVPRIEDPAKEFNKQERYQLNVPWIPGAQLTETYETQSRKRLCSVARKLNQDPDFKAA